MEAVSQKMEVNIKRMAFFFSCSATLHFIVTLPCSDTNYNLLILCVILRCLYMMSKYYNNIHNIHFYFVQLIRFFVLKNLVKSYAILAIQLLNNSKKTLVFYRNISIYGLIIYMVLH